MDWITFNRVLKIDLSYKSTTKKYTVSFNVCQQEIILEITLNFYKNKLEGNIFN